jgi:hypothetical protein
MRRHGRFHGHFLGHFRPGGAHPGGLELHIKTLSFARIVHFADAKSPSIGAHAMMSGVS